MKRKSCLGFLLILSLCSVLFVSAAAILFSQSQAAADVATQAQLSTARLHPTATRTRQPPPPSYATPYQTVIPANDGVNDGVTVEIITESAPVLITQIIPTNPAAIPTIQQGNPVSTSAITATEGPRHSGTSTYPLTVTAEVQFGQTNVARYQDKVAATRTAIAAESVFIYGTLTAEAELSQVATP